MNTGSLRGFHCETTPKINYTIFIILLYWSQLVIFICENILKILKVCCLYSYTFRTTYVIRLKTSYIHITL